MNDKDNCVTLTAEPRKNFFLIGGLISWLILWGGVLAVVTSALLQGKVKEAGFFVVFFLLSWLFTWLLGGGLALYGLLWMGFGSETIVVTPGEISVTRTICGYRRTRCYEAGRIRSLRLAEREGVMDFLLSLRPFGIGNGLLTFDYGAVVVTFADGVEPAIAPELLAAVRRILFAGQESSHV